MTPLQEQETEINSLRKAHSRERDKFDNVLFLIAAGALSLSATFITQKSVEFIKFGWLLLSWVSLVLGLLSLLSAYFAAIKYFKEAENGIRSGKYKSVNDAERSSWWFMLTDWLNSFVLFFVIFGVIFLTIFGYLNIASINKIMF